jgi:hypothetical protein
MVFRYILAFINKRTTCKLSSAGMTKLGAAAVTPPPLRPQGSGTRQRL